MIFFLLTDATYSELGKELEQLEHKLPGTFSNLVEKAKKIVINAHTARKSGNSEGIKNAANAGIELLEQGRLVLKQYPKLVKLIDKLLVKLENMLPKKDILGSSDDAVKYVDEKLPQATLETVQA